MISLDLGSDSSVAFCARPGHRPERIDLQHYLYALARQPALLGGAGDEPSHRLRTRFAFLKTFRTTESLRGPEAGVAPGDSLPREHARQRLLDHERYDGAGFRPKSEGFSASLGAGYCLFRFVNDESVPFASDELLPNAKLVFQESLSPRGRSRYEYRYNDPESGAEVVDTFLLTAHETIRNQVCLILENFIKPLPMLTGLSWPEIGVVLTVPNTYSPIHRTYLARGVAEVLGCHVETISESDALMSYWYTLNPNTGMTETLDEQEARYLTLDVGKGTTDLSLLRLTYLPVKNEDGSESLRRHVQIQARTGRASGGAKATYLVAEFFQRLLDLSIATEFRTDDRFRNAPFAASRRRLLTRSEGESIADAEMSTRLLEFEALCEETKTTLDLVKDRVTLDDCARPTAYRDLISHIVDWNARRWTGDAENPVVFSVADKERLRGAVEAALLRPNSLRSEHTRDRKALPHPADAIWEEFGTKLRAYVEENTDGVLSDLARAHLAGNDGEPVPTKGAAALRRLIAFGPSHPLARSTRIHIIVAGQAVQLRPLRRRLDEIVRAAGLGPLRDESTLTPGKPKARNEPKSWKNLWGLLKGGTGEGTIHDRDVAYILAGDHLKDGCAFGALAWYQNPPILENPHRVHGQLLVRGEGGAVAAAVDMDVLERDGEVTLRRDDLQNVLAAFDVHFLPTRGDELKGYDARGYVTSTRPTRSIRFWVDEDGGVRIADDEGELPTIGEQIYGHHTLEDLKEMLWPVMLLPAGEAKRA